jgi:hypothetical protein
MTIWTETLIAYAALLGSLALLGAVIADVFRP